MRLVSRPNSPMPRNMIPAAQSLALPEAPIVVRRADDVRPLTLQAARSLARSQVYQSAADAPATLLAYKADLANFKAWCLERRLEPMPSTPEIVGAYLADAGRGYALSTLRRRVAAIARAHRIIQQPLDTRHRPSGRRCAASHERMGSRRGARPPSPRRRSSGSWRSAPTIWPASAIRRFSWSALLAPCAAPNWSASTSSTSPGRLRACGF